MALTFGDLGLSLTSGISPLPLTTVQGNDLINLTFRFNYNGTNDVLLENSTTCQELNKTSVFLNFVITFPVVLEIVYPANASNYSGNIDTDFSNCSFSPSLEIDLQNVPSSIPGADILTFHVLSQNLSWTATLSVWLKVLNSARAGSLLNITANATIGNDTKSVHIASLKTALPGNIQLNFTTSIPQTPDLRLTSDERVTLSVSFELPRITADLTLMFMLPTFGNSTPMKFISGSVKSFSHGVISQRLGVRDLPIFNITMSNVKKFPQSLNIARFFFGETVNNKTNSPMNGVVTVEVTAVVESSQRLFVPGTRDKILCSLNYISPSGLSYVAAETELVIELEEPLLEYQFFKEGSDCCYEGHDLVAFTFEVKNPNISTAPALNVSVDIHFSSPHIAVHNISILLCGISVSNERLCVDLNGTEVMTNHSSSGFNMNLRR